MPKSLSHYRQKLAEKGFTGIVAGRLAWYKLMLNRAGWLGKNWIIGKYVELSGNKIRIQETVLSVDNPLITTVDKGPMYSGVYEIGERELARRHIDVNLPTVEIGGSIGGVACMTNKLLMNPQDHVVVECNPLILPTLKANRDSNKCKFVIEPFALAYGSSRVSFSISPEYFMAGRLHSDDGKQVTVSTITLRQIIEKYGFGTINLICDSEGGEVEMVENDSEIFQRHIKCLILETHEVERGHERINRILSILSDAGFQVRERRETVLAMFNQHLS